SGRSEEADPRCAGRLVSVLSLKEGRRDVVGVAVLRARILGVQEGHGRGLLLDRATIAQVREDGLRARGAPLHLAVELEGDAGRDIELFRGLADRFADLEDLEVPPELPLRWADLLEMVHDDQLDRMARDLTPHKRRQARAREVRRIRDAEPAGGR